MRFLVGLLTAGLLFMALELAGPVEGAQKDLGARLIDATKRGDIAAVQAFLDAGVDPDSHDQVNNTALIFAARDGHYEIVRRLLDRGAAVDWIDDERVTALILAAYKGHAAIVGLLLARGADPSRRDQWGRRASDYALRRGPDDPIAQRLLAEEP